MPKSDSLKRAARYAKVAQKVAGAAARIGTDRVLHNHNRPEHAALIGAALGGLKGPLMKIGQLLAVIPDFLPPEYVKQLATLQAHAPSMGGGFVNRRMCFELGTDWKTNFKTFEPHARFAASLGQVHYAENHDGQALACKLQYPDMQSIMDADLRQLKIIFGIFERISGAVKTDDVYQEIEARLNEELDYKNEAKNIELYQHIFADHDEFHIPAVNHNLSTDRLLTMSWLDGQPFDDVLQNVSQDKRNEMAESLFKLWYTPLYHHGVIHGDPHPGNYTFRDDGGINLLDFGCIRIFDPKIVQAMIMLSQALRDNDEAQAVEAYRLWGFENSTKDFVDILNIWARFVYAPVLEDRIYKMSEQNSTAQGRKIASQIYKEVKKIGGVSMPSSFVMIDRASVGLGSIFLRLGAEVNWHRLFMELTDGFDVTILSKRYTEMQKG